MAQGFAAQPCDVEQHRIAYAETVAEAMNLKLDMNNPADREKLRRAVLDLVAGGESAKVKTAWLKFSRSLSDEHFVVRFTLLPRAKLARYRLIAT